jgi:eukaryotic-like serine/threonine-protein kinase
MDLWTEYEGRTIDGAFTLTRLIQPEGRSAFFSTSNGTGVPTVIRLIESHFDGDDILARWRGMEALNHPNLVKLKSFGHVVVDETSLVYAVMEPVDANLGEILKVRQLTELETKQVATSLLAAIEALHSSGFVHEHVEPANVLAVGEVIKLRSDCIRETLEGEEGAKLKRKDVRDYSTVLLQALTQQRTLEAASRSLPLPAPFEQIVRKGLSGEWGLEEIGAALTPAEAVARTVARQTAAPAPKVERPVERSVEAPVIPPPSVARRIQIPVEDKWRGDRARGIAYGVGTLLIVLLGWWFVHWATGSGGSSGAVTNAPAPATQENAAPGAEPRPSAAVEVPAPARAIASPTGAGNWRVIAFTYNRRDEAQQKVAEIGQSHPDLNPSVFTPTGRAPFLVALGGEMSREDAFALSGRAKREGLPKDTYAQNYRGRY